MQKNEIKTSVNFIALIKMLYTLLCYLVLYKKTIFYSFDVFLLSIVRILVSELSFDVSFFQ